MDQEKILSTQANDKGKSLIINAVKEEVNNLSNSAAQILTQFEHLKEEAESFSEKVEGVKAKVHSSQETLNTLLEDVAQCAKPNPSPENEGNHTGENDSDSGKDNLVPNLENCSSSGSHVSEPSPFTEPSYISLLNLLSITNIQLLLLGFF